MAFQQFLPGERGRFAREDVIQGSIRQRERPRQLLKLDLAGLNRLGRDSERLHDTAKARIAGQGGEDGARMGQPVGAFFDVRSGAEQQSIAFEESPAIRLSHAAKQVRVLRKGLGKLVGRHLGVFRCRRLDDRRDSMLRK